MFEKKSISNENDTSTNFELKKLVEVIGFVKRFSPKKPYQKLKSFQIIVKYETNSKKVFTQFDPFLISQIGAIEYFQTVTIDVFRVSACKLN